MRVALLLLACGCGSKLVNADSGPDLLPPPDADPNAPDSGPAFPPTGDSFDGIALQSWWTVLDPSKVDVSVAGGQLTLTPHANALWYNASEGGLVYQLVPGDIGVTTTVHVHKSSSTAMPPDQPIELGGLMARAPGSSENYVLVVVGYGEQGHLAVEHKTTTSGVSTFAEQPFSADAQLRLCRQGTTITVLHRAIGATAWTQDLQIARPDLPTTLQIGLVAYDGESSPDIAASFDDFGAGGCTP